MPSDPAAVLYVGIKRSVLALDAATGLVRWSTELPGSTFSTGFVTLHVDGAHVFAATAGELTCLDAATGVVRWHNALEGYGLGFATLATANGSSHGNDVSAAAASAAAAAAAAVGGAAAATV